MRPCPASLTHSVLDDHRRMRDAIIALEAIVRTGSDVGRRRGVVAALVVAFGHELARHFVAEEEGGLFEQLEREAPETAAACARLRAQHVAILEELDRLRESLPPARAPRTDKESWTAAVRGLVALVREHERCEDELLLDTVERAVAATD
jgi:iron-sulfur cluster repair protein YtfE (RIC family)